jgi:hypothetical protein
MPRFAAVSMRLLAMRPSPAASTQLVVALVLLAGAAAPSSGRADGPVPVKILFDSDMGSDCDDAGALALLHTLADEGKAEIVGCVFSSGRVPYGAAVMEAINVYYGRPHLGATEARRGRGAGRSSQREDRAPAESTREPLKPRTGSKEGP